MQVINLGDLGRERAGVDDTLHPVARRVASVSGSRRCRWLTTMCTRSNLPRRGSIVHGTFPHARPGEGSLSNYRVVSIRDCPGL